MKVTVIKNGVEMPDTDWIARLPLKRHHRKQLRRRWRPIIDFYNMQWNKLPDKMPPDFSFHFSRHINFAKQPDQTIIDSMNFNQDGSVEVNHKIKLNKAPLDKAIISEEQWKSLFELEKVKQLYALIRNSHLIHFETINDIHVSFHNYFYKYYAVVADNTEYQIAVTTESPLYPVWEEHEAAILKFAEACMEAIKKPIG